jgi:hypothetical protein
VQLVVLPVDLVVTLLQTSLDKSASAASIIRDVYRKGGLPLFWSGLGPGLMLTINPGITMVVKAVSAEKLPVDIPARNFCVGLLGKMVAILFTDPYYLLRIRMQTFLMLQASSCDAKAAAGKNDDPSASSPKSDENSPTFDESTLGGAFKALLQTEGPAGAFKGLGPHMTNAVLKEAILNATKVEIAMFVARSLNRGGS